jgi:excisionase family DNA binding protein
VANKLLLRPEEAAERLGIGRSTVFGLLADGRLESVTIGRRRLIRPEALTAFIDKAVQRAAGEGDSARGE